jgi:hypothetical protein
MQQKKKRLVKDFTIKYDPFKVVREGNIDVLLEILASERDHNDSRY